MRLPFRLRCVLPVAPRVAKRRDDRGARPRIPGHRGSSLPQPEGCREVHVRDRPSRRPRVVEIPVGEDADGPDVCVSQRDEMLQHAAATRPLVSPAPVVGVGHEPSPAEPTTDTRAGAQMPGSPRDEVPVLDGREEGTRRPPGGIVGGARAVLDDDDVVIAGRIARLDGLHVDEPYLHEEISGTRHSAAPSSRCVWRERFLENTGQLGPRNRITIY